MSNAVSLKGLGAGILEDQFGNALSSRQVFVYQRGTTNQVSVYADSGLSIPLSQPLTTGSDGTPGAIPGYVANDQSLDFLDIASGLVAQGEAISGASLTASTSSLPSPSGGDDSIALNAAITNAATGSVLVAPPNVQYQVAATWTIGKAVTIKMNGSGIKKILSGASNFSALDLTVDGIMFDGQGAVIDGNRSAQPGSTSGTGWRNTGSGTVTVMNVTVQNCGGTGVVCNGQGGTQQTILINCQSNSNLDPSVSNNANGFALQGVFRCYGCSATNNAKHGFLTSGATVGGSNGGGFFDGGCRAVHNFNCGFAFTNTGAGTTSIASTLTTFDNGGGGVLLSGTQLWEIGTIITSFDGNAISPTNSFTATLNGTTAVTGITAISGGPTPAAFQVFNVAGTNLASGATLTMKAWATLSGSLSTGGGAITSLPVTATDTTVDIPSGATIVLSTTDGAHTQTWTTTGDSPGGSTSIPVSSQTPNFNYPGTAGISLVNNVNPPLGTLSAAATGSATQTVRGGYYIDGSGREGSGFGLQITSNCTDVQIGTVVSRAPSGYGISIDQSTDIEINVVSINGTNSYDGDPGIQVGGSCTDVHIGTAQIEQRTRAVSMGETPSGGNVTRLTVDRLITDTCTFGAVVFGSNANQAVDCRIGKITDWDSYTNDGTKPGLIEFMNATRCSVDEIDQKNDGTNKPVNIIHAQAASSNCSVRLLRAGVYSGSAAIADGGTGNSFFLSGLAPKSSAWQPAPTNANAVNQAIAENLGRDALLTGAIANAPASGTLTLCGGLVLPARRTISNIMFVSGTQGASAAVNQWFCLVTLDLKIVAVTVDDGSTAWAASTKKMLALSSSYTPDIDTPVWAGICVVATTRPTLTCANLANTPAVLLNDAPVWAGTSTAGLSNPLTVGTSVTLPSSGLTSIPYCRVN